MKNLLTIFRKYSCSIDKQTLDTGTKTTTATIEFKRYSPTFSLVATAKVGGSCLRPRHMQAKVVAVTGGKGIAIKPSAPGSPDYSCGIEYGVNRSGQFCAELLMRQFEVEKLLSVVTELTHKNGWLVSGPLPLKKQVLSNK